jgi:Secretion system C-terminal sorting domain
VQSPIVPLRLTATSAACTSISQDTENPPFGLNGIILTDDVFAFGSPVCVNPSQLFTATAKYCAGNNPNSWSWTPSGQIVIDNISNAADGVTSTVTFRLIGATGGGPAQLQASYAVNNAPQPATLSYTVLNWPECEFSNPLMRKPKETGEQKPQVLDVTKEKMEGVNLTEADNTEGMQIGEVKVSSNNVSTIKRAIYPNPAKDFLTVEGIDDVDKIQIVDLNGRVIRIVDIEQNEVGRTLNISDLTNGMYILKKIKRDGQLEAAKFQVMH